MKLSIKDYIYLPIILLLIGGIVLMSILWLNIKNEDKSYYQTKCDSFAVQNANLSKGQIVFIGDSITDLYPLDNYYADLNLAAYNRGIAGDVTQGVLDRLKVSLYDLNPSKIVLMIGINDLNSGQSNEYVLSNYDKILSGIKNNLPTTSVYCMSVLPLGTKILDYGIDIDARNTQIMQLNPQIQTLCSTYGCTYVDLFSSVCNTDKRLQDSLTDDGIHLNANGFAAWTSVLKPLLI